MADDPRSQAPRGLAEAVAIFRELGWEDADIAEAPTLPLASPEQRRGVADGLKSGQWRVLERTVAPDGEVNFEWVNHAGVDHDMLRLFAVRHGVPSPRAVKLLRECFSVPPEIVCAVVAERGPAFADAVVRAGDAEDELLLMLVHRFDLEPPVGDEYLTEWADVIREAISGPGRPAPLDPATLRAKFGDHLRVGSEVGSGDVAGVLGDALSAQWVTRDGAREAALVGLDSAPRPKERKAWTGVLTDDIQITDAELMSNAPIVTGLLAAGEGPVTSAFAPRLIALVDDAELVDVVTLALTTKVKAVRLLVLAALAKRPAPADPDPTLVEQLAALAGERDPKLAKAATAVLDAWQVTPVAESQDSGQAAGNSRPDRTPTERGVWRATPQLWQVPRLEVLDPIEGLVAGAAVLVSREARITDVETERFLACLVASAWHDVAATKAALRGIKDDWSTGLTGLFPWVQGKPVPEGTATSLVDFRSRDYLARLGEIQVLLSTPSWVDLRVDPADLVQRLQTYADAGVPVGSYDLQLALTRLELDAVTPEQRAWLAAAEVPVDSGSRANAAAIALAYLDAPVTEPPTSWDGPQDATPSPALAILDDKTTYKPHHYTWYHSAVFPRWTEATCELYTWNQAERGLFVRQFVRRATPLEPIAATRLLGSLRGLHARAEGDTLTGVIEAFERGLLRPGVADGRGIGLKELALLARRCLELADEGLTSVVWPFLDSVIGAAISGSRMAAGVADLAEAMFTLTPTVLAAVPSGEIDEDGDAGADAVFAVPGLRALAAREGSSRAVTVAREVVAMLPQVETGTADADLRDSRRLASSDEFVTRPGFDEIWPQGAGDYDAPDDQASLRGAWETEGSAKVLTLEITIDGPDAGGYRVHKRQGHLVGMRWQCGVKPTQPDDGGEGIRPMWWDGTGFVVLTWTQQNQAKVAFPVTFHAVLLAHLSSDGAARSDARYYTEELLRQGALGWRGMRTALARLLALPDFSPARVATTIDQEPKLLPALWPVLVDSITFAADMGRRESVAPLSGRDLRAVAPSSERDLRAVALPAWLSRVLDVTRSYLPYIREAAERGWIPAEAATLPGLAEIAARQDRSAAVKKARDLVD